MQCSDINDFGMSNLEKYQYFVIGGSHSAETKRQLVMEHPATYLFSNTQSIRFRWAWAWDHNNNNDYRQKMPSKQRIMFFHYEYLDALGQFGPKLNPRL